MRVTITNDTSHQSKNLMPWHSSISYHFLPNREGGHEKAEGSQIFFMRNRGVTKNQEIIGWLQILMKILLNEISPNA